VEFDIPAASGAFPGAHFGDVLPNLETLRGLIRHCGLELSFRLFNADLDEHDATLIAQLAPLTPEERVDRAVRAVKHVYAP
jgi:hypothetical protein